MSANRRKTDRKAPKTAFKPGQSGNPSGRPKKRKELTQRCKDMTDKVLEGYEDILENGKDNDKIEVGKIILAYAYGKPDSRSKIELSGKDAKPLAVGIWLGDLKNET